MKTPTLSVQREKQKKLLLLDFLSIPIQRSVGSQKSESWFGLELFWSHSLFRSMTPKMTPQDMWQVSEELWKIVTIPRNSENSEKSASRRMTPDDEYIYMTLQNSTFIQEFSSNCFISVLLRPLKWSQSQESFFLENRSQVVKVSCCGTHRLTGYSRHPRERQPICYRDSVWNLW